MLAKLGPLGHVGIHCDHIKGGSHARKLGAEVFNVRAVIGLARHLGHVGNDLGVKALLELLIPLEDELIQRIP